MAVYYTLLIKTDILLCLLIHEPKPVECGRKLNDLTRGEEWCINSIYLTLTTQSYICINHGEQFVFQFEIIKNVL